MKIAVVGLGHVGLPLAAALAHAEGVEKVYAIDMDIRTAFRRLAAVETLREAGLHQILEAAIVLGRLGITGYERCDDVDVVMICVQTPVNGDHEASYDALAGALGSVGAHIMPGTLVIVESTIAPGTMEMLVIPILEGASGLENGSSLYTAHCPERINPGDALRSLCTTPRIIGGTTHKADALAVEVYEKLGVPLYCTDAVTAEIVKTAENAYRDVQIAFANELAQICMAHSADVWTVRDMINTCPGRHVHRPSIGVGGHCLPKDSWLLLLGMEEGRSMIAASRVINEISTGMAAQFIEALFCVPIDTKIVILGVAYKADSGDIRNSPSFALGQRLEKGSWSGGRSRVQVYYHDPHVEDYSDDLATLLKGADIVILAVGHTEYLNRDWEQFAGIVNKRSGIFVNCCEREIHWPTELPYYKLFSLKNIHRSSQQGGE